MLYQSPDPRLPNGEPYPSLGGLAIQWIESNLEYGPGDMVGKPYRLEPWQKLFLWKLYIYNPDTGRRIVRRALFGTPKGNSKSEMDGAISLYELLGPCVIGPDGQPTKRKQPDIVTAAASAKQANLVYGAARQMADPLHEVVDRYQYEMHAKGDKGKLYRVAAEAATNDGLRPSAFIADEIHEWLGRTERVHLVIGNGLTKREDSVEVNTTTAGASLDSLAGRLYQYGKKVALGEVEDPTFLFYWYEAEEGYELTDPDEEGYDPEDLRRVIRECNPGSWVNVEAIAQRWEIDRLKAHEFSRYYLNLWREYTEGGFLPAGTWAKLEDGPGGPPDGTTVVLGFDGSWKRDSTALYGWTLPTDEDPNPYGFEVATWENHDNNDDWRVPRHEVAAELREAFRRWEVYELVCDPYRWEGEIEDWSDEYGEVVTEFPTNSQKRMAQACGTFYSAVVAEALRHDGSPTMARHLGNAITKETASGEYITKQSKNSPLKIDVAVAGIIGFERVAFYIEDDEYADVSVEAV